MPGSLFWSAPEGRWRTWALYDDAVALHRRWRSDQLIHWADVDTVTVDCGTFALYQSELGSVLTQAWWRVGLGTAGPDRLELPLSRTPVRTLASDFRRYGVRADRPGWDRSEVYDWVADKIAACQLPAVQARIDDGAAVEFGPIRATSSGLSQGHGADLPWAQVASADTTMPYNPFADSQLPSEFRIRAKDSERPWFSGRPAEVTNLPTLLALTGDRAGLSPQT
jgi:hypothetical protein